MKLTLDKLREMIEDIKRKRYNILLATPSKPSKYNVFVDDEKTFDKEKKLNPRGDGAK